MLCTTYLEIRVSCWHCNDLQPNEQNVENYSAVVGLDGVLKFSRNAFTRTYVSWNPMGFQKRDLHQISMKCFLKKSLRPTIWWAFRKKSQSDLLRQGYHMKHPRGKLSFHEIPPGEISVFSNLMGPQNEKSIRFLKTVTSYEAPHRKLHQKFSQNTFTRNASVYRKL